MLEKELIQLVSSIKQGKSESQTIELKSAYKGAPKVINTLSSFSNQNSGGVIIFGIDENSNYETVGVYDAQDLQHQISEQCKQMQPSVRALFTVTDFERKVIVSAEIPAVEISERPVYYKGVGRLKGSYIRVGDADELMSEYEVYTYDSYKKRIRDDIRIAEEADTKQFDDMLIENYLMAVKLNKKNVENMTDNNILNLMGITKNEKPTLTGVMCFSKYPQATFPQLCITAVRVPGTEMGDTLEDGNRFIDNQRIEGTIPQMLEEAVRFVYRNMKNSVAVLQGVRKDIPEYPITAIREVILNALMHRDYSVHTEGSPIRIEMYSDRIEISNCGGLYGAMSIEEIGKAHSDIRNQTLVTTLEILKKAENRYSGIPTIRKEMEDLKLPPPIFENKRGVFKVILKNSKGKEDELKDPDIIKQEIFKFLEHPKTRTEIAEKFNMTQYYLMQTYIKPLIDNKLVGETLPDKAKSKFNKYFIIKSKIAANRENHLF